LQDYWANPDQRVQATLEASVPSSTLNSLVTQQSTQTRQNAQDLRMKLEELDTLHRDCEQLVHRAQTLVGVDDIRPRILKMATGFERLAAVTPAMFENILDEELAKFDKYLSELVGMKRKHENLLNGIQAWCILCVCLACSTHITVQARNKEFLKSRREDPAVKEREQALQLLDLAYLKYREITKNLEEGFNVKPQFFMKRVLT
jgi:programmed cell death 6-interacting protein